MHFNFSYPKLNGEEAPKISLSLGTILFVLGANGTGKSAFLTQINTQFTHVKRILAQRQTSFGNNGIDLPSTQLDQFKAAINQLNRTPKARCSPDYLQPVSQMRLSELLNVHNQSNQIIADVYEAGNFETTIERPLS
jgi:energy-coupling factor transporter ATP-binding protein EcfA2